MLAGYRTLIVAVALAALGAVQQVGLADVIPAEWSGFIMMAIGFVVAWLRTMTTGPIGADKK